MMDKRQNSLKESRRFRIKVISTLLAASIIAFLFNYNLQIIIVRGDSMAPTFENRQILIVKNSNSYRKNDIVVFQHDGLTVKRIVGMPGSVIRLSCDGVSVDGVLIRPYTYDGIETDYKLTEDEYFVIGDNYHISYDSRDYGPISESSVIGKVVWPNS